MTKTDRSPGDGELVAAMVRAWRSLDPADEVGRAIEALRIARMHSESAPQGEIPKLRQVGTMNPRTRALHRSVSDDDRHEGWVPVFEVIT